MNLEPKAIIPFISSEEGLVTKFTIMLDKPMPLEQVIELCGSGKGKRLTNDPIEPNTVTPKPLHVLINGVAYEPMRYGAPTSLIGE